MKPLGKRIPRVTKDSCNIFIMQGGKPFFTSLHSKIRCSPRPRRKGKEKTKRHFICEAGKLSPTFWGSLMGEKLVLLGIAVDLNVYTGDVDRT